LFDDEGLRFQNEGKLNERFDIFCAELELEGAFDAVDFDAVDFEGVSRGCEEGDDGGLPNPIPGDSPAFPFPLPTLK